MIPLKDNIPTTRFPIVTAILIALNFAVFAWELTLSKDPTPVPGSPGLEKPSEFDQEVAQLGAIPDRITHPGHDCVVRQAGSDAEIGCPGSVRPGDVKVDSPWWATVFTSMFMHADILHIVFNMLFLWIFGNNIEDAMGRPRYIAFYLLSGIAAVYAFALLNTNGVVPLIGASGAIAGVLGGYALLYPRARVLTVVILIFFVTLVEIPAWIFLAAWLLLVNIIPLTSSGFSGSGGGVAYAAHIGGFLFGLALIKLFANRHKPLPGPEHPVY